MLNVNDTTEGLPPLNTRPTQPTMGARCAKTTPWKDRTGTSNRHVICPNSARGASYTTGGAVGSRRIERRTSAMSTLRSNQLSYEPETTPW